ncbi:hypothetical protein BDN72DRAFT_849037 [Pluteus cervinus]|uniref:Uncharacterized protein n=1 Tax=Pluteus cervinus TaxID=181527 RepID=A0ACD3A9V4_9AGAR|nr:hypothetical protein BDN72DRAFT_849037 [Pluteus cervinus]
MGGESKCYSCGKNFAYSQLKRCSRCLLVRYCSRECQKTAWTNGHNKSCKPHPQGENQNAKKYSDDWFNLEVDKVLSRWLDVWRSVLCHFAMVSLDLANHPADYNATHMMVLWLIPRVGMKNSAQNFKVTRGEIWPLERCDAEWPELEFTPAKDIEDNRLRTVIVLEDWEGEARRVRTFTWQTHSVSFFRRMDEESSKSLAADWLEIVKDIIEGGDVAAAKKGLHVT